MRIITLRRRLATIRLTQYTVTVWVFMLAIVMPILATVDEVIQQDDLGQFGIALGFAAFSLVLLLSYRRSRSDWIPGVFVLAFSGAMSLGIGEPFVTHYVAYAVVIPPILAMLIAGPRWVILSVCCMGLIVLARAGWQGAYANPTTTGITAFALAGLLLNNQIRAQAISDLRELNTSLELRVRERTQELTAANEHLAASREAMAEVLRHVAHDLSNMLTVHQGNTDLALLALEGGEMAELEQSLDALRHGIQTLAGFVSDLQASSHALSGRLTLSPQPTDLVALSQQVGRELAVQFRQANIAYSIDAPADTPPVWCDQARMLRVLLNLVGNAVKFTRGYGSTVCVHIASDEGGISWSCADDGRGIAPEKVALLGQEFQRVVEGDSAPSGHGIGAHFCHLVMHLSGGTIRYDSPGLGKGTTVVLTLPQAAGLR